MAVPKFFEFFKTFLEAVSDGEIHHAKDVRTFIANEMKLTEKELAEKLPSGRQTTFDNRVAWARTYLDRAGLISTPTRAHYCITEEGKKALNSGETIDLEYLKKYPSFQKFHSSPAGIIVNPPQPDSPGNEDKTPKEILDEAFNEVNTSLAEDLMTEVMKLNPEEFEKLVVKLLLKMGYGSGIDNAGYVTSYSKDGGIDGTIKEDHLGFSTIYIQAKQWALDSSIGRPEIQKFVGALYGEKANKGLFITTARFCETAKQFVKNLSGLSIVLIDGEMLMRLMIKYNLGVSIEQTYEVKRIDADFFSDSL